MLKIKRLYTFMLQTFLPLFIMTFGICLFIVLMQFLWKYIDDMVGKGLDMLVLGEMFLYATLSLVPMALPLSILLASLMTFGNLGERLELLAMKSAGVSLIRIMRPLIIFLCFISVGAFFFQNNIMPVAQVKLYSLLLSMRQKSPELDIPVGVFYNDLPGYNLYVRNKDNKTGLLKDLMIYNYSDGFDKSSVIVADSGKLKTSADKLFVVLSLFEGEAFKNIKEEASSGVAAKEAVPYMRESFKTKEFLIEFDANFTRTDESFLQTQYVGKDIKDLQTSIDSMGTRLDSIKDINSKEVFDRSYKRSLAVKPEIYQTTEEKATQATAPPIVMNYDSIYAAETKINKATLLSRAKSSIESVKSEYIFRAASLGDEAGKYRRHLTEWHKKFTLSFACLVFFFIGAPLGAIIRKGGLGTPVVISVLMFIFYYIIDNIGFKMARDGVWEAWQGMWLSSAILAPLGVFLTYKAVNDSVILDADTYLNVIKNLIGKRSTRKIERKDVIIFTPDYKKVRSQLEELTKDCTQYLSLNKRLVNYISFWKEGGGDNPAKQIATKLETIVEELGNSDQNLVLNKLMDFPIIWGYNKVHSKINERLALAIGLFLPIGLPIYLLGIYKRKLLRQDILTIQKVSEEMKGILAD